MLKVFLQASDELGLISSLKFMLPDAEDGPAAFPQGGIYATVAGLVARDLGQPEGGAGPRPGGVFRAAVPEAAVDEDGGPQFRENKVGSDGERFLLSSGLRLLLAAF